MDAPAIKTWNQLTVVAKQEIFNAIAIRLNIPAAAIEKDWWVTRTLEIVF